MLLRLAAAVLGCLLLVAPVAAAESCMKWEDGVRTAAEFSRDRNDRIAAVLLTAEETAATWNALFPGKRRNAREQASGYRKSGCNNS